MNSSDETGLNNDTSAPQFLTTGTEHSPAPLPENSFGLSFSMLLLLTTIACIFFASWQWHPFISFGFLALITPSLWRTIWVVHHRTKQTDLGVGFFQHLAILATSFLTIGGTTVLFSICFIMVAGGTLSLIMAVCETLLDGGGQGVGFILGIVIGFPLAASSAIIASVWILHKIWQAPSSIHVE